MGSLVNKKAKMVEDGQDRISRLPDQLIHKILSFVDAEVAVQTSVFSKRWKLIWTILPFLNFGWYEISLAEKRNRMIRNIFYKRNNQSHLFRLKLFAGNKFPGKLLEKFVAYAISHNVEYLYIRSSFEHNPYKLSTFSSGTLKKLKLQLEFDLKSDFWDLPALTYLCLKLPVLNAYQRLSDSCFTCLPVLRTLCLHRWDLSKSIFSFSLPVLTTLRLFRCTLPQRFWNFPALLSLDLYDVIFPDNIDNVFSGLLNLQNLTLSLSKSSMQRDILISCPQLLNLHIKACYYAPPCGNIVISSPKLCNFSSAGIFSIRIGVHELGNVNIKLPGWSERMTFSQDKSKYFTYMLPGLGIARHLTFDLESIKVLSAISDFLATFPSPFYKLKCVKLPQGYKESSLSAALRNYLLGGSPSATIVTTLPQSVLPQTPVVTVAAEDAVLQKPVEAPSKELVDCPYINNTVYIDTVDMAVQNQHIMKHSPVATNRVRQIDEQVERTSNDRVSSSSGNKDLWQDHEVNSEFVCLLNRIMHKYPETFEHFMANNKKLCKMYLNMLCTSVNHFTKISMTEVTSEMIAEYRDVFAYLQNHGLNASWLVNRLNYIEHIRFSKPLIPELHAIDCRIDDAKSKFEDLQALRMEKMREIQKAFGTFGTNLALGFIGDDLLSGL